MNPIDTGRMIARYRKEAGYTQASLARALNITDKAVSKWECGYGLPDSSLLPQIAKLLDCDIEILISGYSEYKEHEWTGLLILEKGETAASTIVYDKPLIHYLLSYFLLVGITNVEIRADVTEYDYIRGLHLEQYGFHISFSQTIECNTMVVFDKALLFGANLTRSFQNFMSSGKCILPVVDEIETPIAFTHYCPDVSVIKKVSERKKMGRGVINLPLTTSKEVKDASEFVRIYQEYHNLKIADLNEIAKRRTII